MITAAADRNQQIGKHKFAQDIVKKLQELDAQIRLHHLVIVAPPRTLAVLRKYMPKNITNQIMAEIDKDLTKHTISDITRILTTENEPIP